MTPALAASYGQDAIKAAPAVRAEHNPEYPEQAAPHADIRRLLNASQLAHTVQMWARAGFAPPIGPAPRRGVDAQLVRA